MVLPDHQHHVWRRAHEAQHVPPTPHPSFRLLIYIGIEQSRYILHRAHVRRRVSLRSDCRKSKRRAPRLVANWPPPPSLRLGCCASFIARQATMCDVWAAYRSGVRRLTCDWRKAVSGPTSRMSLALGLIAGQWASWQFRSWTTTRAMRWRY